MKRFALAIARLRDFTAVEICVLVVFLGALAAATVAHTIYHSGVPRLDFSESNYPGELR